MVGRGGGVALASVGIPSTSYMACWRETIISICINTCPIVHFCGVVVVYGWQAKEFEKGCVFCWAEQRGKRRIFIWTGKMFRRPSPYVLEQQKDCIGSRYLVAWRRCQGIIFIRGRTWTFAFLRAKLLSFCFFESVLLLSFAFWRVKLLSFAFCSSLA